MVESSGSMPCSLKMTRRFSRGSRFIGFQLVISVVLFQDRAVSVVDEAGAYAFGFFDIAEGAELHAQKFVGGTVGDECGILFFLERVDQGVCIFLLADCGDLYEIISGRDW